MAVGNVSWEYLVLILVMEERGDEYHSEMEIYHVCIVKCEDCESDIQR